LAKSVIEASVLYIPSKTPPDLSPLGNSYTVCLSSFPPFSGVKTSSNLPAYFTTRSVALY